MHNNYTFTFVQMYCVQLLFIFPLDKFSNTKISSSDLKIDKQNLRVIFSYINLKNKIPLNVFLLISQYKINILKCYNLYI